MSGEEWPIGRDVKMLERSVYVLALFTIFGAYRYKLSAFALVALLVSLGSYLTHHVFPSISIGTESEFLISAWSVLLPLNLVFITVSGGEKPGEGRGGAKLMLVLSQILIVWFLWDGVGGHFASGIQSGIRDALAAFLGWRPDQSIAHIPDTVSLTAILSFAISLLALMGRQFFRSTHVGAANVGILLCAAGAALSGPAIIIPGLFYVGAITIVFVSGALEIYRLAFIDDLTGIPSRRAFNVALRKQKGPFSVAIIDVDHFKRVNDKYGHEAGDQALRMIARHIRNVAGGGKYFRFGGEEFAILFVGKEAVESAHYVEVVRENLAATRFGIRAKNRPKRVATEKLEQRRRRAKGILGITITFSAGVAQRNDHKSSPQSIVVAADKALHQAKNNGRNRTVAV